MPLKEVKQEHADDNSVHDTVDFGSFEDSELVHEVCKCVVLCTINQPINQSINLPFFQNYSYFSFCRCLKLWTEVIFQVIALIVVRE
jgi:hypothetical protein